MEEGLQVNKKRNHAPSWRGVRGNATVEFAIVLVLMISLLISIVDFGRVFYIQLTLHSAVREATRFALTGNVLPDPNNPGEFLTRVESIVSKVQSVTPGLGVQPGNVVILGPNGAGDAGGPGDLITIRCDYDIDLLTPFTKPLFPGGVHRYSVAMMTQNEPFDPS